LCDDVKNDLLSLHLDNCNLVNLEDLSDIDFLDTVIINQPERSIVKRQTFNLPNDPFFLSYASGYKEQELHYVNMGVQSLKGLNRVDKCSVESLVGLNIFTDATFKCRELYLHRIANLTSLTDIEKYLSGITVHTIFISPATISGILGLLKVANLQMVEVYNPKISRNEELISALKILNKHLYLQTDMLDCQSDLIEAGLKDFAKL
jgi:hypothetical protein